VKGLQCLKAPVLLPQGDEARAILCLIYCSAHQLPCSAFRHSWKPSRSARTFPPATL